MHAQLDSGLPQTQQQAVHLQIVKLENIADKVANSHVLQVSIANRALGMQLNAQSERTAQAQEAKYKHLEPLAVLIATLDMHAR